MKSILKVLFFISLSAVLLMGCTSNESSTQQVDENNLLEEQSINEQEQNQAGIKKDEPNTHESIEEPLEKVETEIKTDPQPATVKVEEKEDPQPAAEKESTNKNIETTKPVEQATKQPTATKTPEKTSSAPSSPDSTTQPVTEQPKEQVKPKAKEDSANTATITIKADAEIILPSTKVEVEAGDTVLDVLKNVTKEKRIHMEYQGRGPTAYIEGINNLYEFDKGPKSGWMYSVNGNYQRNGAGVAEVKPGDQVEWVYTLDLGRDVGASW